MSLKKWGAEDEFKEQWSNESEILIDATEQRRQKPGNQHDQKEDYSGKKKHTP